MTAKKPSKRPRGPEPERLNPEGSWQKAIAEASNAPPSALTGNPRRSNHFREGSMEKPFTHIPAKGPAANFRTGDMSDALVGRWSNGRRSTGQAHARPVQHREAPEVSTPPLTSQASGCTMTSATKLYPGCGRCRRSLGHACPACAATRNKEAKLLGSRLPPVLAHELVVDRHGALLEGCASVRVHDEAATEARTARKLDAPRGADEVVVDQQLPRASASYRNWHPDEHDRAIIPSRLATWE